MYDLQTGGSVQTHLQQLHYEIVGWKECGAIHSDEIYQTHICAAFPGYGKAQCSVSNQSNSISL